ncbi:MAG TPA: phosphoglycerate kinase [Chloroflexia bacterium]|nr:phosphoglycerate kinase [Chloroflexia bacterium]
MPKRTLADLELQGRKALVRVDFNVPLDKKTNAITDDTRVRAALPTIRALLDHGAAVILMSHLGRPKGVSPSLSLEPVAAHLRTLLPGVAVDFAADCVGDPARQAAQALQPGAILLLENLRFHPEEEANDAAFAAQLAALGDVYVNDAFGSAHRAHASTEGVAHLLPSALGLLMEREVCVMGAALEAPERPFVAILGGAKVSDKMGVITNLLGKVDSLLIGGGMANTFLRAQGYNIGDSLVEADRVTEAEGLITQARERGVALLLPTDVVLGDTFSATAQVRITAAGEVPDGWRILDIGPVSAERYAAAIRAARTVVWNGPMGVFEFAPFAAGTLALAQAAAAATDAGATTIIGGGDSVAAVEQAGLADRISHISTGGGASLEFLEGRVLPGVAAIGDR